MINSDSPSSPLSLSLSLLSSCSNHIVWSQAYLSPDAIQGRANLHIDRILTMKNAGSSRIFSVSTFAFILLILSFTESILLRGTADWALIFSVLESTLYSHTLPASLFPYALNFGLRTLVSFCMTFFSDLLELRTD